MQESGSDPSSFEDSSIVSNLRNRILEAKRWAQYQPWYIRISMLDRRIQYLFLIVPLVLILIIILAVSIKGVEECISSSVNYRGTYSKTESGLPCIPWSQTNSSIHSVTPARYEGAGLTGSYCRDPDYSGRVWCYTSPEENKFDYCDIKECEVEGAKGVLERRFGSRIGSAPPDFRYKPNTDTSCLPEISVINHSPTEICLSWHAGFRHWWITHCLNAGILKGVCPYEASTWRAGGTDKIRVSALAIPVYNRLVNCLEYDIEYTGEQVAEGGSIQLDSFPLCKVSCLQHPICKAFAYTSSNKECILLHKVESKNQKVGVKSGAHTCKTKEKVGCPKEAINIGDLCLNFLISSTGICQEGCSRFRAMEECELTGGYLVDKLNPETAEQLFNRIKEDPEIRDTDWWTAGSDMSKLGRFTWERESIDVPKDLKLWQNTSEPNPRDTHSCVFIARNKS
ncbi:uncharacterized protein LOC111705214 [Eurytemora carolleeae]|uniref:uncharacterized protein LOC111705214 n=1 Tax=Eurytemora carolleeae TaxID=1294199 RepID=UPI000C76CF12|nr:uncharacterized protein LOC111705214 [Eurytemora carolleeae]|eukprot:XP_023333458.1 uncharacterized protein LOC111705214 [Eurytemora affinis]